MIILDTNILRGTALSGPAAELLRAIRGSGERVAVPWIVMEEVVAARAGEYAAAHAAAAKAMKELDRKTGWAAVDEPEKADAEVVREHWRGRYGGLAEVIPSSAEIYQAAMFRETNVIPPCKTVEVAEAGKKLQKKIGGRDAIIWLTAVQYAKDHAEETVYFVTGDSDFREGADIPAEMRQDIAEFQERFVVVTSLDRVLGDFTSKIAATEEDVRPLLETANSLRTIASAAHRTALAWPMAGSVLTMAGPEDLPALQYPNIRDMVAAIRNISEVSGYEVGGHKWFTLTVRWLIGCRPHMFVNSPIYASWETRVLVSPTAENGSLTVLDRPRFKPITPDDATHLPALPAPSVPDGETPHYWRGFINLNDPSKDSWVTMIPRLPYPATPSARVHFLQPMAGLEAETADSEETSERERLGGPEWPHES